jgi:hypothetical protein
VISLLIGSSAIAQSPPRSHRDAAIALGEEGLALFESGEYMAALRKFDAADELIPAPTFGVRAALCLEQLGRLVEALERYERVAAMQLDPSWPEIHRKAQTEAKQRAADLQSRVARLRVILRGNAKERPSIKLDGRQLSDSALGSLVLIDPGEHVLEFAHEGNLELRRFHVREGAQHREGFLLGPALQDERPASSQRTAGWVSVGLGAAGVAVGSASGLVAWSKKGDLEAECPNRTCPPNAWSDNATYDRWRKVSTVGFAVGSVALGLGTFLLLTDSSKSREADVVAVQPWVGMGSLGVQGGF